LAETLRQRGNRVDVIANKASLDQVMWCDPSTRLYFLPAGVKSHLIHTSEILASEAMKDFFGRLREGYEYVDRRSLSDRYCGRRSLGHSPR
jgi:hypothetical protein